MGGFRFSFNLLGLDSRAALVETCRQGERYGYDTVFAADHLGMPAPFPALVAAAAATERLRVGTLVLNAAFWNPALLAREVATTDVLTDGRLELGLGAGHMKWEFDEAGIPWAPFGARAGRLEATIDELARLFAADGYEQQAGLREAMGLPALAPVQRRGFDGSGPPLLIGGTGERILRIAAERADIVGIAGTYQVKGRPRERSASPRRPRRTNASATRGNARVSGRTRSSGRRSCRSCWRRRTGGRPPRR